MTQSSRQTQLFLLVMLCLGGAAGCGSAGVAGRIEQARRHLQFARPQAALDTLADLERLNAEGHYLKAVALEAMGQRAAAKAEIQLAVDRDSDNPKYQGYQWRLRLFDGDRDAIDPILDLQRENSSSAALNLFAVFAREARALRATSLGQPRTARAQRDLVVAALKTSLGLAKSLPEFYPELISLAMKYGLSSDAERLAQELVDQEPDNVDVTIQHIRTLTNNGKTDQAISEARNLFQRDPKNVRFALVYASVLASAQETPDRNKAFSALVQRHRFDADVVAHYGTYLARNGHVQEAVQVVTDAIPMQKEPESSRKLAELVIALILDARSVPPEKRAEMVREQLALHRKLLADKAFVLYCEGRILHLEGKYVEALEKMADAVRTSRTAPSEASPFGQHALRWMQRIMADGIVSAQLEKALSAVKAVQELAQPEGTAPPDLIKKPSTPTGPPDTANPSPRPASSPSVSAPPHKP